MLAPSFARMGFRLTAATGLIGFGFLLASLDPFLSAAPLAGSSVNEAIPPTSVNRGLKSDRLPLFGSGLSRSSGPSRAVLPSGRRAPTQTKMPVGCDPSFSPVSSPSVADIYGRCTV